MQTEILQFQRNPFPIPYGLCDEFPLNGWASGRQRLQGSGLSTQKELGQLVLAVAKDRDRAAFATLFDHFGPRLQAYLIRLGSDTGSAEEIIQDVMTTLWTKADLFDPDKSSIGTWLYRIARNRRIDGLRRNRIDYFDPLDAPDIPDETPDVDRKIDLEFREDKVRLSLSSLPAEQLELVRLAFFDGLSHSEIADKTGLPLGTVKSRIRLAFTKLRRTLESDGVVEAGE